LRDVTERGATGTNCRPSSDPIVESGEIFDVIPAEFDLVAAANGDLQPDLRWSPSCQSPHAERVATRLPSTRVAETASIGCHQTDHLRLGRA
jgi:hypothetical protein